MKHSRTWPVFCALAAVPLGCGRASAPAAPSGGSAGSSESGAPTSGAGTSGGTSSGRSSGGAGDAGDAGGAGGADGPEAGGAGGASSEACDVPDLVGLRIHAGGGWDPLGYPPYALDGCKLVYVADVQDGGALVLRDLASGAETVLEEAASRPRRPAVSGAVIAWEVGDDAVSEVRVHHQGLTRTLTGNFQRAGEPRVCADAVVFTAFSGEERSSDSDVYLYDVASDKLAAIASGPGQQRFADVSLSHVALTDFSEDPAGYFDERESIADVVVVDRETGEVIRRQAPGKQAFPLLASDGAVVYLHWGSVHPEPKFSQFWLKAGYPGEPVELDVDLKEEMVETNPAYVRPSLHGVHVDFVDAPGSVVGLYRVSLSDLKAPVATFAPSGAVRLLGPVAGRALTLVAQQQQDQTLSLVVVEH